jgi:multiple sugar transport system substrate-binding protein
MTRNRVYRARRILAGAVVLALALAGCGRDEENGGGQLAAEPEGPVEGTIQVWAMGTEGENLGVLAEDFMQENSEVTVDVTAVPWDAAHDRIVNAIAGGEVPDVSLVGTTWMGEFAELGGLAPTPSSIDPEAFFEGAWETTVVDDTSYGVPWYVETRLLYYRTDVAEKAGISEPPSNWDELKQLVEGLAESGSEYGISLQPGETGTWQTFMPFFWQKGGEIADENNEFTLDSPACVEALAYYDSFFEDGQTSPEAFQLTQETAFAEGQIGSFISGPWMVGLVDDAGAKPDTWTVAHQPVEEAGTSFVGGGNLAVFEQADNKPAAWAFIEYLSQPEVQVKWYETVSGLPAVTAAWDDETLAEDEVLSTFGEQLEDAQSPPAIPTWEQVAAAIDSQIEQVTVGDASPEDACRAMQEEASSIGTGL